MNQSDAPAADEFNSIEPVDPDDPLAVEVNVDGESLPASPRRRRYAEASPRPSVTRRFFDFSHATRGQICLRVAQLNGILIILLFAGYGFYNFVMVLISYFAKP